MGQRWKADPKYRKTKGAKLQKFKWDRWLWRKYHFWVKWYQDQKVKHKWMMKRNKMWSNWIWNKYKKWRSFYLKNKKKRTAEMRKKNARWMK